MRDVVRTLELKRITTKWITRGIFFFYLWYFSVSLSYPSFPSHPYHSQVLKIILFLTVSFSFPLRLIFLLKVWEKQWWKNNVETLNSWVRILTSVFYQKYKFIKYICKKKHKLNILTLDDPNNFLEYVKLDLSIVLWNERWYIHYWQRYPLNCLNY